MSTTTVSDLARAIARMDGRFPNPAIFHQIRSGINKGLTLQQLPGAVGSGQPKSYANVISGWLDIRSGVPLYEVVQGGFDFGMGAVSYSTTGPVQQQIIAAATAKGLPPSVALAVAQQESGFNQSAVGTSGEIGIFQVMPSTAPGANLSDTTTNINTGVGLLAQYYTQYNGNLADVLTAYNAGPSRVGNPPPPTQNYITSVEANQQQYSQVDSSSGIDTSGLDTGDGSTPDTTDTGTGFDLSSITDNPTALYAGIGAAALILLWAWTR